MSTPRIALVTGASSGIGRAAAIALNAAGWTVILSARRKEILEETVGLMEEGGRARTSIVVGDLGRPEDVKTLFEVIRNDFSRLDLLFNNAGIGSPKVSMEEIDLETFQSVMNVNVTASFQCAQEAIRIMKAQTPQGGRSVPLATTFDPSLMQDSIINNGSISAYVPRALSTVYTMSKHAILGMTKCIALDYREYSIACSQIDIGNADTKPHQSAPTLQADGAMRMEPKYDVSYAGAAVVYMASLPLDINVYNQTLVATNMPFVGRG